MEFKNPYSCKNLMIDDAISAKKGTCLVINNGRKSMKTTHNYYYQVQTTMLCTGTWWCDFFLRITVDIYCERIAFEERMYCSILPKLPEFYICAILPELTLPCNSEIREHKEYMVTRQRNIVTSSTCGHVYYCVIINRFLWCHIHNIVTL